MKVLFVLLGLIALFFGGEALISGNPPLVAYVLLLVGANFLIGAGIIDAVDKLRSSASSGSRQSSRPDSGESE